MEKGAIFSNADDLQTGCAVRAERSGLQYKPHPQRKTHWRSHAPKDKKRSNAVVGDAGDYLLSAGLSAGGLDCVQPGRSREIGDCPRKGVLAFLNGKEAFEALSSALLAGSWLSMKTNGCLNTRPVYFGKKSFSYALAVLGWRALSRNALAQREDGYKRQKAVLDQTINT